MTEVDTPFLDDLFARIAERKALFDAFTVEDGLLPIAAEHAVLDYIPEQGQRVLAFIGANPRDNLSEASKPSYQTAVLVFALADIVAGQADQHSPNLAAGYLHFIRDMLDDLVAARLPRSSETN